MDSTRFDNMTRLFGAGANRRQVLRGACELPAKARAMLDRLILPEAANADALAIVVATLGSNGLEARARELARQIPMSTLRPEERDLIRPWIVPAPLGTVG